MEVIKKTLQGAGNMESFGHKHHTALDGLFRYADFLNFGEVHIKFDHRTGLKAIVAIHNLKRGPAIGGCRFIHYAYYR